MPTTTTTTTFWYRTAIEFLSTIKQLSWMQKKHFSLKTSLQIPSTTCARNCDPNKCVCLYSHARFWGPKSLAHGFRFEFSFLELTWVSRLNRAIFPYKQMLWAPDFLGAPKFLDMSENCSLDKFHGASKWKIVFFCHKNLSIS